MADSIDDPWRENLSHKTHALPGASNW
jgi:hypothetical protein